MKANDGPKLIQLRSAPATERARFALDHHGIRYVEIDHTPFINERRLRRLAGNPQGVVTVPLLLLKDKRIMGSWDITRYADAQSGAPPLFVPEQDAVISQIIRWVEEASELGRTLVVSKLLKSPAAMTASLPWQLPGPFSLLTLPAAWYGSRWFARKYQCNLDEPEQVATRLGQVLQRFREQLNGRATLLDRFSVADIGICSCLQGIVPLPDELINLAPAVREVWTQPELAKAFADLIEYRDAIYANYRRQPVESQAA